MADHDSKRFAKPRQISWPGIVPLPSPQEDHILTRPAMKRPLPLCGAPCCLGSKLARICDEDTISSMQQSWPRYLLRWILLD